MTEIIEYITLNYVWFLGGLILILLAIIGSYADKTNFGQPKSKSLSEELKDKKVELENKKLGDLVGIDDNVDEENLEEIKNDDSDLISQESDINESESLDSEEQDSSEIESLDKEPSLDIDLENLETNGSEESNQLYSNLEDLNISNRENGLNDAPLNKNNNIGDLNLKDNTIASQESHNDTEEQDKRENSDELMDALTKFDEAFEAIVPKREIIDADLLDDIDDLNLDDSKKFKSTEIPDLDDVELPEISNLKIDNIENNDIWKF